MKVLSGNEGPFLGAVAVRLPNYYCSLLSLYCTW